MVEINNETFILIGIVIFGLIIIKLLGKFLFRLVGVIVLLIIGGVYSYFYTDFFNENQDNTIIQKIEEKIDFVSVIDYQARHCNSKNMSRKDSITCECIIKPLVKDLQSNYTEEEIAELKKDKQKYRKELIAALKRNQDEIQRKLKEHNAIYIWNLMVRNMKKGALIGEY
jgi:energy-coupling factor transporter transmembrane protein EcfT